MHAPLDTHPQVPLQTHARYSRIEVLATFGVGDAARVPPWQSGVGWAKEEAVDLLATYLATSGQDPSELDYWWFNDLRDQERFQALLGSGGG